MPNYFSHRWLGAIVNEAASEAEELISLASC